MLTEYEYRKKLIIGSLKKDYKNIPPNCATKVLMGRDLYYNLLQI